MAGWERPGAASTSLLRSAGAQLVFTHRVGPVPPALSPLLSGELVLGRPQAEDGETTVSCRPRDHSVGRILGKSTPTSKGGQMVREGCEDPEG